MFQSNEIPCYGKTSPILQESLMNPKRVIVVARERPGVRE
jgi:hypothetical protein